MTLKEIRSELGIASQDIDLSRYGPSYYNHIINQSYYQVCRDIGRPSDYYTADTTANTQYLALPTAPTSATADVTNRSIVMAIERVLYDGYHVKPATLEWIHERFGSNWDTTTGSPKYYWVQEIYSSGIKERLYFYPTPDAAEAVEIWFTRRPQLLSADADIPEIPIHWHELVVLAGMCRVSRNLHKADWYQMYNIAYGDMLRSARAELAANYQGGEPVIVQDA